MQYTDNNAKIDYKVFHAKDNHELKTTLRILITNPITQEFNDIGLNMVDELLVENNTVQILCISGNRELENSVTYSVNSNNSHIFFSPILGFTLHEKTLGIILDASSDAVKSIPEITEFIAVYKYAFLPTTKYTPPRDRMRLVSLTKDILE